MSGGDEYEVGYGKPPKGTRFQPGQSGNPSGRKAGSGKKAKSPIAVPLHPTRRALTERADRLVVVLEDGKRHQVATRDAIFGALAVTALKGGVMAQRTMIQLMQAEDERLYAQRSDSFNFWRDHVRDARSKMRAAQERGRPLPQILPHPDDVLLDYETLTVRIVGPANEEELLALTRARRAALLCLELSLYHREDNHLDQQDIGRTRVGFWLAHHIYLIGELPPRMRSLTEEEGAQLTSRAGRAHKQEAHLRSECEALGVPFFRFKRPWRAWEIGNV